MFIPAKIIAHISSKDSGAFLYCQLTVLVLTVLVLTVLTVLIIIFFLIILKQGLNIFEHTLYITFI